MDNTLINTMETLFAPVPTDDVAEEPILEAVVYGSKVLTNDYIWRSCTGRRYKNGVEYHGPVYSLGNDVVYTGARLCGCAICQANVDVRHRKN